MFTHVMLGSKNPEKSRSFYDKVLGALGIGPSQAPEGSKRHFYGDMSKGAGLGVGTPYEGEHVASNGGMASFSAENRGQVDAFHREALANGGTCAGAPGERAPDMGSPYGAYVRDPDGNKLAAFTRSKA